jgi:hypothetical protein
MQREARERTEIAGCKAVKGRIAVGSYGVNVELIRTL